MADIFSNLYLAQCVMYYNNHNNVSEKMTNYTIKRLLYEIQTNINIVICNLSLGERMLLGFLYKRPIKPTFEEERIVFNEIMENPNILNHIKQNIHITGILKTMEDCLQCEKDSEEYNKLRDQIINVGEYKNSF